MTRRLYFVFALALAGCEGSPMNPGPKVLATVPVPALPSNYSITCTMVDPHGYVLLEVYNKRTKTTHLILRHSIIVNGMRPSESMIKLEEWKD